MKKLITVALLAISAFAFSSMALAVNRVEVGYRFDNTRNSTVDQRAVVFDYHRSLSNGFTLGGGVHMTERDESGNLANRYFVGAGYEFSGPFTGPFYVQAGLGHTQQSAGADGDFWQVETGARYNLTETIQLKLAYQLRDGFNGYDNDFERGPRATVQYQFTDSVAVGVNYDYFTYEDGLKRDRLGVSLVTTF